MVTVCVVTYNQEKWIRQTLDSILAQQTDFPFEVIIGEDHGSDGTRTICQEYADKSENITLLPSSENLGVTANWIRCIQAGTGKYIMTCAGDDFWHNPQKIQMQVDFMETHPACVLCHTEYDELNVMSGIITQNYNATHSINPPVGRIQQNVFNGTDYISPLTGCIRRDAFEQYVPADEFARRRFPREDWPTHLVLTEFGEVYYMHTSTATYRTGQESITKTSNYEMIIKRAQQDKEMTEYLYSIFPNWGEFKDGDYYDNIGYHNAMLSAYRNNDFFAAKKYAKLDKYPTKATYMAYTWLTFKIYRLIKKDI